MLLVWESVFPATKKDNLQVLILRWVAPIKVYLTIYAGPILDIGSMGTFFWEKNKKKRAFGCLHSLKRRQFE